MYLNYLNKPGSAFSFVLNSKIDPSKVFHEYFVDTLSMLQTNVRYLSDAVSNFVSIPFVYRSREYYHLLAYQLIRFEESRRERYTKSKSRIENF